MDIMVILRFVPYWCSSSFLVETSESEVPYRAQPKNCEIFRVRSSKRGYHFFSTQAPETSWESFFMQVSCKWNNLKNPSFSCIFGTSYESFGKVRGFIFAAKMVNIITELVINSKSNRKGGLGAQPPRKFSGISHEFWWVLTQNSDFLSEKSNPDFGLTYTRELYGVI